MQVSLTGESFAGIPYTEPFARALLSRKALQRNVQLIRSCAPNTQLIAMVKANAYGHGMIPTVRELMACGVNYFGVVAIDEALLIRKYFPRVRILLWGGVRPQDFSWIVRHQITPVIGSLDLWYAWCAFVQEKMVGRYPIHFEIDTGIARGGLTSQEHARINSEGIPNAIVIEGIASHYVSSESDTVLNEKQHAALKEELAAYRGFSKPPLLHCSNSAGIIAGMTEGDSWCRPGMALYGHSLINNSHVQPEPVMTLEAQVIHIKHIQAGEGVSYNHTFVAQRPTRVATLGVGYADGIPRALSNRAEVHFGKKKAAILGRICMDVFCVDVTDHDAVVVGSWARLFGHTPPLSTWAELNQTIVYEILCGIGERVRRQWVDDVI